MSIYTFAAGSPIRELSFHHANDRPPVALIEAADNTTDQQLHDMRRDIGGGGWICVPVTVGGKDMLQVSGFDKEQQFVEYLREHHFSEGPPEVTAEAGDNPKRSTKEWLQDTSQKIVGWSYIVGDISLMISGLLSGRTKEATSGILYTSAGVVMARYGNVKTEHHLREVSERTAEFIREQAGNLPEDCSLSAILKARREGALPNLERFLSQYPMQVGLGICGLGSLSMLQSGLAHKKPFDIAYGTLTGTLTSGVLLLPEKKADETKTDAAGEKKPPVGQLWDWISAKPMRVAGYAYMLGAGLLGMSAYKEFRANPKQRSYIFKFISAATYLIGDLMIAISSKDHVNADGKFDDDEQRRIEALTAEAIARQPRELQEALVHHVAGFLATQPEMKGTSLTIGRAIGEQLRSVGRNRWAHRTEDDAAAAVNTGR